MRRAHTLIIGCSGGNTLIAISRDHAWLVNEGSQSIGRGSAAVLLRSLRKFRCRIRRRMD